MSLRIAQYLHTLYRLSRCYTFLISITDPRALYPSDISIHPGWRFQDIVILATHHINKSYKRLIYLRFWAEIPNIIAVRSNPKSIGKMINVFTVLPYYANGDRKSMELDIWLVAEKQFLLNNSLLPEKFESLNGAVLRIALLSKAPFFIWGDKNKPYLDGLDWRLILLICNKLNYTINDKMIYKINHSGRYTNGNWSGAMSLLQNGQVDIVFGGVSSNTQRLNDFDFCSIYYRDSYVFISPISTIKAKAMDIITKPLSDNVWLMLLFSFICVALAFKLLAKRDLKHYQKHYRSIKYTDNWYTSFWCNVYLLYNMFCQKPFYSVPNSTPLRCVFLGTSVAVMILGIILGGSIFSRLLENNPDVSISTLSGIYRSKLPVYIMNYDGHLNLAVHKTKRIVLKKIWEIGAFTDYYESFSLIDEVVRGNCIYIDSSARLNFVGRYQYAGKHGLKFHFGTEKLITQTSIGWPTRKRWPFQNRVNQILSRAVESGLVDYWMSMFNRGKFGWDNEAANILNSPIPLSPIQQGTKDIDPTLAVSTENRFSRLGMEEFDRVISIWWLGIVLSFMVFIGELATHGTWTTMSLLKRLIEWAVSWVKMKKRKRELIALQKALALSSTKTTNRKKKSRVRYDNDEVCGDVIGNLIWADLSKNSEKFSNTSVNGNEQFFLRVNKTKRK